MTLNICHENVVQLAPTITSHRGEYIYNLLSHVYMHCTQCTMHNVWPDVQHSALKKNRSIWLNDWILPLSPERTICICQVDSCIRRVDSLNVTLSQVLSSLKKFKKTIIMHELFILNKNLLQSIYFDLTRIKKLDFDSSYFYSFCLLLGSMGSNLTSYIWFL